jgi:hypothetical protein
VQIAFPGIVKDDFAFGQLIEGAFERTLMAFGAFYQKRLHSKIKTKALHDHRRIAIGHSV